MWVIRAPGSSMIVVVGGYLKDWTPTGGWVRMAKNSESSSPTQAFVSNTGTVAWIEPAAEGSPIGSIIGQHTIDTFREKEKEPSSILAALGEEQGDIPIPTSESQEPSHRWD